MSIDEEESPEELAKDKQDKDRNIWRTNTTDSQDGIVKERNALEIAQGADRLAWVAMWISIVAVVISVTSAAITLSLQ